MVLRAGRGPHRRALSLQDAATMRWAASPAYRAGEWGYQETMVHLRLGERPEAQVWINHPGEVIHSGYGRPSYWGGCGTVPRVQQYRDLAVVDFAAAAAASPTSPMPGCPRPRWTRSSTTAAGSCCAQGAALCLIAASGPLDRVADGPTAGCELRLAGRRATLDRAPRRTSATERQPRRPSANASPGLAARDGPDGAIVIDDPDYGTVVCAGRRVGHRGRGPVLDPAHWTRSGTSALLSGWDAHRAPVAKTQRRQEPPKDRLDHEPRSWEESR